MSQGSAVQSEEQKPKRACPECGGLAFDRLHSRAHGLPGTHMTGSEHYKCKACGHAIFKEEGVPLGFKFFLDK